MHPELKRRLEFIGFDENKVKQLKRAWPVIEKNLPPILDEFYKKVMGRPELAKIVGDPSNISRLKDAQRKHWAKLFEGSFDDSFYEDVRRIGKAHERIGLTPESYVSAYNFMLGEISALLFRQFHRDSQVSLMVVASINALLVDVEMAITVYYEETQNTYHNKLQQMSHDFEETIGTVVAAVASSAEDMSHASDTLISSMTETQEEVQRARGAAEISADNATTVAGAAEELDSSIREISSQVSRASTISNEVEQSVRRTSDTIETLNAAADQIGTVVDLIDKIASQTNLLAADAYGGSRRCLEMARDYALEREQFGQIIGAFQAVKHQLANLVAEVEPALSLYWYAAHAIDREVSDASRQAAVAKARLTDVFDRAARDSTEIHGGIGFTWEYDLQLWFRRSMFDRSFLGDAARHRERAAELAGW